MIRRGCQRAKSLFSTSLARIHLPTLVSAPTRYLSTVSSDYSHLDIESLCRPLATPSVKNRLKLSVMRVNPQPGEAVSYVRKWVETSGGYVHPSVTTMASSVTCTTGVHQHVNDADVGLFVTQPVERGDILVSVPLRLCISTHASGLVSSNSTASSKSDDPLRSTIEQAIQSLIAHVPPSKWQVRLGLRLLAERAQDISPFKPHIDSMPSSFPTMPYFFTPDAMKKLQYHPLKVLINSDAIFLRDFAKKLHPPPAPPKGSGSPPPLTLLQQSARIAFNGYNVSLADLAWAVSAASSRAFAGPPGITSYKTTLPSPPTLTSSSSEADIMKAAQMESLRELDMLSARKVIVPVIDLMSHSLTPNCEVIFSRQLSMSHSSDTSGETSSSTDDYNVILKATRDIQPNEELFINYFQPHTPPSPVSLPSHLTMSDNKKKSNSLNDSLSSLSLADLFLSTLGRVVAQGAFQYNKQNSSPNEGTYVPNISLNNNVTTTTTTPLSPSPTNLPSSLSSVDSNAILNEVLGRSGDSTDYVVAGYGFVQPFNPADILYLDTKPEVLEHMLTIADELPNLFSGRAQAEEEVKRRQHHITMLKEQGLFYGQNGESASSTESIEEIEKSIADFLQQAHESVKESLHSQLVIPLSSDRTEEQQALLDALIRSTPEGGFHVGWKGPSCQLLAFLRIAAAGAYYDTPETVAETRSDEGKSASLSLKKKKRVVDPKKVHAAIDAALERADEVLSLPENAAATIAKKASDVALGWGTKKLTQANEHASALLLYAMFSMVRAGFPSTIDEDLQEVEECAKAGRAAEFTALRLAIAKKTLLKHAWGTIATPLGADASQFPLHQRL